MNNFEHPEQQLRFKKIVREGLRMLLSASVLLLLIYFLGGFYKQKGVILTCNAEKVTDYKKEKFFEQGGEYFGGGHLQSTDYAHSHQHSVKLSPDFRYGLSYKIMTADGDEDLKITVWRYNPEGTSKGGAIVCSGGDFYKKAATSDLKQDSGWERLTLRAKLPLSIRNKKLEVYCMTNGDDPVYFDDLNIDFKRTDK